MSSTVDTKPKPAAEPAGKRDEVAVAPRACGRRNRASLPQPLCTRRMCRTVTWRWVASASVCLCVHVLVRAGRWIASRRHRAQPSTRSTACLQLRGVLTAPTVAEALYDIDGIMDSSLRRAGKLPKGRR